eukprot:PhM_4_TR14266/c0_g1_i3/m.59648
MVRCKGDPSNEADVHRLKVACLKAFIEPREPTAIMPGLGGVVSFGAAPLPAVKLLVARWSTSVVVDKALKEEYVADVYEHYEQYRYSESRERQEASGSESCESVLGRLERELKSDPPADPKGWQSKRPVVEAPQLVEPYQPPPQPVVRREETAASARKSLKDTFINVITALRRRGINIAHDPQISRLFRVLEEALLWEEPKKAPLLSSAQLSRLLQEKEPSSDTGVGPTVGARFADVARIRAVDVSLKQGTLAIRVRQQKNIRKRVHQRWLTLAIPDSLVPHLGQRLRACRPHDPIVTQTYRQFLAYLKTRLGPTYTTYSIRRTIFEILRQRLGSIEEIQKVTLHANKEQLRWHLERPTRDEMSAQLTATSWHYGVN